MLFKKIIFLSCMLMFGLAGLQIVEAKNPTKRQARQTKEVLCADKLPQETLANLGALRGALSVYYGDTEGVYPPNLQVLVSSYIPSIPPCVTPWHGTQTGVQIYSSNVTSGNFVDKKKILNTGKWGYVYAPSQADHGLIFVDSKHCDSVSDVPNKTSNAAYLGTLRSAVSIYYGDTDGNFPPTLDVLVSKYIRQIPPVVTTAKGTVFTVTIFTSKPQSTSDLKNTGGWGYVPTDGTVFIDSSEDDLWKR